MITLSSSQKEGHEREEVCAGQMLKNKSVFNLCLLSAKQLVKKLKGFFFKKPFHVGPLHP